MNFLLPTRDVNGLILTFVFWFYVTQRTSPFLNRVCFNDFLDISNILVIETTASTLFKCPFNFHLLGTSAETRLACRLISLSDINTGGAS